MHVCMYAHARYAKMRRICWRTTRWHAHAYAYAYAHAHMNMHPPCTYACMHVCMHAQDVLADHPAVDVAALNRFGCAAVQWAAAAGSVESCRWLIRLTQPVRSALGRLLSTLNPALCRWLQSRGISLTHVNKSRHGAVQKAAWKGCACNRV